MPNLFEPLALGDLELRNRIVMSPLTRCRAVGAERIPNDLMAEYYRQRASFGLIITEGTVVTPMGVGYPDTPGIWSDDQVEGWKKVIQAVHDEGGLIFCQLWHVGRVSDPELLGGELPVAPSAIAPEGHVRILRPQRPHVTPRALETEEIPGIVAAFRQGAENAKRAGFDGVEIHGANGYLLDEFLQTSSNHRTDDYGGSVENRARLMLEVAAACAEVWGPKRVGVHLAPRGDSMSMGDENPLETFTYLAGKLGEMGIGFICARERQGPDSISDKIRQAFGGAFFANEGYSLESAQEAVRDGRAEGIAFGQLAIANPDLVRRLKEGAPLNSPNPSTFYGSGPEGYTDYPSLP